MAQGTYTATNLPSDGETIDASDVTTDLTGLIDEFNKNIGTSKIEDLAVTTAKINDLAVTTGKIADLGVTAAKLEAAQQEPVGSVKMFAGSAAPTGYLLCDGTAISRTTYSALFAVISTTYGTGDGSTTFNLPNMKGKVVAGYDSTQTEFNSLGKTGGAKTVNIAHTHTTSAHNHTWGYGGGICFSDGQITLCPASYKVQGIASGSFGTGIENTSAAGAGTTSSGLSSTQSVLNPYISMNYIIKA